MENQFNLSDFGSVVPKSNFRKEETEKESKVKPYNVKFDFKKQRLIFDTVIAAEINLENNSLAYAPNEAGKAIAIIVVPGNQGVFGKKKGNKNKGRSFKNKMLAKHLVEFDLTSGTYKLNKLGTGEATIGKEKVQNCDYYLLDMVGEPKAVILTEEVPSVVEAIAQEPSTETKEVLNENQNF